MTTKTRQIIIWTTFLVHLLGIILLALGLTKGLPPTLFEERLSFLATRPTIWTIGWAIWMVAAATLILFYAVWATTLRPEDKVWGYLAIGIAFTGGLSDWISELLVITQVPHLAGLALTDPIFRQLYLIWEASFMTLTSGLANLLYGIGGILLTLQTIKIVQFPQWLALWNFLLWGCTLLLSIAVFLSITPLMIIASALTFGLLLPWFLLMGYGWLIIE
ncbi:MAG: hypothetical protein AAF485_04000, partial [Chloroflexota bacterium]